MAKGSQEREQEFIATAKENTGHDLKAWMKLIDASGESKTNSIIKWIKAEHGLNHMQANMLAGIYLNDGKPVFDYAVLLEKLFEGNDAQRPVYEALSKKLESSFDEIYLIPTKAYVSVENERVFGCIKINKSNLRIGVDLGERPFDDYVQQARGLGAMPNIGHMVEISSEDELNDRLLGVVREAYERGRR